MTDHTAALKAAAEEYRRKVERAKEIHRQADDVQRAASEQLAETMRAAYRDGTKKADILRATGHVWSRTWVDRAVKDGTEKTAAG